LLLELHWQEPAQYEWVAKYINQLVDFIARVEEDSELDRVVPF
jgi:hypothetical protein